MAAIHPLYRASQRAVTLDPELRGRPLLDALGERIGHIDDVLIEDRPIEETGELNGSITPRYLEIGSGGLFHLGERKVILPIDDVSIEADGVHIQASRVEVFGPAED